MYKIGILCFLVVCTIVSCVDESLQEFSNGNEKFSADIIEILNKDGDDVPLISPLSTELVLAALAEGAKGNTEEDLRKAISLPGKEKTREAVKSVLALLNKSSQNFDLILANKICIHTQLRIKPNFIDIANSYYRTEVGHVEFIPIETARNQINTWMAKKTNNHIQGLLAKGVLQPEVRLVLVDALYLTAKWKTPFPVCKTSLEPFQFENGTVGYIDMMRSANGAKYLYYHCGIVKAKFLEIPFKDSNVSVTFVLPDARDGLSNLQKQADLYLKPHNLTLRRVDVRLPKISASVYHNFKDILIKLGLSTLVEQTVSDLSGIFYRKGQRVRHIWQGAIMNFTEAGANTEAARADEIELYPAEDFSYLSFNADHPFAYFIKDTESNIILFIGQYK